MIIVLLLLSHIMEYFVIMIKIDLCNLFCYYTKLCHFLLERVLYYYLQELEIKKFEDYKNPSRYSSKHLYIQPSTAPTCTVGRVTKFLCIFFLKLDRFLSTFCKNCIFPLWKVKNTWKIFKKCEKLHIISAYYDKL